MSGDSLGPCPRCGSALVALPELEAEPYCDRCFLEALAPPSSGSGQGDTVQGHLVLERHGRYRCVELLGEGGMGKVWRAWDEELARWVALKLLKGRDPKLMARFERESKLVARLGGHPNVAQVFEAGEVEGQPFIAMPWIAGRTLDAWSLAPARTIARLVRDAARGVAHAHESGVVHRDLKPANVIVTTRGLEPPALAEEARVYVMDFGLARGGVEGASISLAGELLGTPEFMSPEQARGDAVDERSDVYSLGATLYFLLTGRAPFLADDLPLLLARIAAEDPTDPALLRSGIPREVITIALACLAKEPERRYADAGQLAADLERFLVDEPVLAQPPSLLYLLRKRIVRQRRILAAIAATLALSLAGYGLAIELPRRRLLEAERARLRPLLSAKRAQEERFAELSRAGRFEEAVALASPLHGTRVELPELEVPAVAREEEFASLHEPYRVALPHALRALGQRRLAAGDARGKSDLARAYRAGRDRAEDRADARGAILDLSARLLSEGSPRDAVGAARLALRHLGTDDPQARAALARGLQRTGELEHAAACWERLRDHGELGPEAREQLSVLAGWLPRRRFPPLRGATSYGDHDGDGELDVLVAEDDWSVRLLRPRDQAWSSIATLGSLRPAGAEGAPRGVFRLDLGGAVGRVALLCGSVHRDHPPLQHDAVPVALVRVGKELSSLGSLFVPGRVMGAVPFDLDGDGANELLTWTEWPFPTIQVLRLVQGRLQRWFGWNTLAHVMDLEPLGPGRLLAMLGIWRKTAPGRPVFRVGEEGIAYEDATPVPWGYRVVLLGRGEDGAYREIAAAPFRVGGGRLVASAHGGVYVSSYFTPEFRAALPGGFEGVAHLRQAGDAFAATLDPTADRAIGSARFGASLRDVIYGRDGLLRLHVASGAPVVLKAETNLIDGPRLPGAYTQSPSEIVLQGLGGYQPRPLSEFRGGEALAQGGELSPSEELLEIGLYAEALDVIGTPSSPRLTYARGVALERLGRAIEAADAFAEAARDRGLRVDALLRRGHCLEESRQWSALRECVERVLSLPEADGLARAWAEPRARWSRGAGVFNETLRSRPFPQLPLYVENPFKVVVAPERLVIYATSEGREAAGVLVENRAGCFRARLRFVPHEVEWASGLSLGLQARPRPGPSQIPLELTLVEVADGATNQPYRLAYLNARGGAIRRPNLPRPLTKGIEHLAEFEHVAGAGLAYLTLSTKDEERLGPIRAKVPLSFAAGELLVGSPGHSSWRYNTGAHASRVELRGFQIEHAGAIAFADAYRPPTASDRLAWANGLALRDLRAAAEESYAAVLEDARVPAALRARAALFRGSFRLRWGADAWEADLERALALDAEAARSPLLERRAPALSAPERSALRASLGLPADEDAR